MKEQPTPFLRGWFRTAAAAIALVLLVHYWVFTVSPIHGHSMEPALRENDWVVVNKAIYGLDRPRNGDIVVLAGDDNGYWVKRVAGEPGDRIELAGGRLYRNGQKIDEPYTGEWSGETSYGPIVVEAGSYFVLGDNRGLNASLDSRAIGPVPLDHIKGRVDWIVWPIRSAGPL
ncbi:signal peptidase I [Paenibacillus sp. PL2-23]|uniref:signal peptidase I n=1 Tax=Paenibacillus sp. PL2-23 TaxID=2100729 RepID=UPI0030F7FFB8